ncbi:hypothetical protein RHO13_12445 [Orbus wheelerorum]|uniref:hypothetical protein n=1 Tax=Orbus wheelerorum TaxID=3074111 RepID=UPI00370D5AF1
MYYSEKPANIIATNSMFILNEHYDGKTIQVGGTIPFPDTPEASFNDGRYNTYLYLKTFEEDGQGNYNGKNKYVKIVIKPTQKVFISEYGKSLMRVNDMGEITSKDTACTISIVNVNDFSMNDEFCDQSYNKRLLRTVYSCYFYKERGFYGDSASYIMRAFNDKAIKDFNIEVVDDIDLHILYMAEHYKE